MNFLKSLGSAISEGFLGAAGNLGSEVFGVINNAISYDQSKSLARYQNELQMQNWREMNEYNSPKNQMLRYQEAGLNPNLIYGNISSGNASSTGAVSLPRPQNIQFNDRARLNERIQRNLTNSQIDETKSRENLNNKQAEYVDQQKANALIQNAILNLEKSGSEKDLAVKDQLITYQLQAAEAAAKKSLFEANDLLPKQKELLEEQLRGAKNLNDYKKALYDVGLNENDPLHLRAVAQAMVDSGMTMQQIRYVLAGIEVGEKALSAIMDMVNVYLGFKKASRPVEQYKSTTIYNYK